MKYLLFLFFSPAVWAADFKSVLEQIGNNHAQVRSAQFAALAQKSAQIPKQYAWSPTVAAEANHPIREWGLDAGESAALTAQLNLFKAGADGSGFLEARKSISQADLKSALAVIEVEDKAARIIFQWIELQRQMESQQILIQGKRELVRVAQDRFKRGQLPAQEVEKVRLDLSNAEVQNRQAEVELLELKGQMEAYLPGASELQEWPWQKVKTVSGELKVKKLSERYEFQKLNLESEIFGHRAWQATASWLPRVDLTSSWATAQSSPIREQDGEWTALLTLSVPLWDRGQALSERRSALHLQDAARSDLRDYENSASAQLRTLAERSDKLQQNLVTALQASERARNLAGDSLRRFQLGRSSVNDLLIDQSRVYDTDILAQQSLRRYHLVLLELCLAADERPSRCYN